MQLWDHYLIRHIDILTFSKRACFTIVLVALVPGLVLAELGLTEEDLLGEIPLVMTATRLPQSVTDTPAAMTVIDRQMIDASGFVEIPDLLRLVPGFQVGLSWRDHHTAVTYHGQTDGLSRRMQLLIDGRVAVGSTFGLIDWDRLGIIVDDIDRIEVVRGPAGVAYGSNAFIGAINIITRAPFASPGWRLTSTQGSQDTSIASVQYAEVGEQYDYRVSGSYFHTDGFDRVNDHLTARSGRFQGRYQISPGVMLDAQFGKSEGPWGRGGSGIPADPVDSKKGIEQYGNIRLTKLSSPGNEWYIQLGISSTEEDESVNAGTLAELLGVAPAQVPLLTGGLENQDVIATIFDISTNQLDLEYQQLVQFSNRFRGAFGLGYRKDQTRNVSSISQGWEASETYRASGNVEFRLSDKWLFNIGALYEDNDLTDGKLSYRLGLNRTLNNNQTVRLSFAESWRLVYLGEQNIGTALRLQDGTVVDQVQLATEQLNPERLRSYELGYLGSWFEDKLSIEFKAYREEFDDEAENIYDPTFSELISIFNYGSILYSSGGSTEITGIETGVKWKLSARTNFWLSYGFSEVDQHCLKTGFRCTTAYDATPRHTASVLIAQDFGSNWQASLGYYYLDDMAWILWGGDREKYDRVDMRIAKMLNFSGSSLKLELIGQNLGGDYHEFNENNVFETRTFVRATLQFH